jgi:Flp pilus assembly pilin Flp
MRMTDETPVPPDAAMNGPEEKHKFSWSDADTQTKVATVGVIMVGAALIEVGLIPGMIVGVAATMAPKYVPQIGAALKPAYRSIVRGAYKFGRKARAAAAEAQEQVQDIVAEVHAEGAQPNGTAAGAPKA